MLIYFVDKNITNDTGDTDDWLFVENGVIATIKTNISELKVLETSFKREFGYIDEFRKYIDSEISLGSDSEIASSFDKMTGKLAPSTIITSRVINKIMSHTFSEAVTVSMGGSSVYKGVINDITTNLANYTGTYVTLFTELDTLDGYVSDLVGITSTALFRDQANASPNIGEKLDNIKNMTCCGGIIAWKIADILFDTIMGFDNVKDTAIETSINNYLSSTDVNFYSYETTGDTDDGYYSGIVTHIVSLLN